MKDNDGQTPLHLTTRNRHARCLHFLLKRLGPGMVEVTDNQDVCDDSWHKKTLSLLAYFVYVIKLAQTTKHVVFLLLLFDLISLLRVASYFS